MKKLIVVLGVSLALVVAFWSSAQSSQFKVIVHKDNPTGTLSAKDISNLLLKRRTRWSEGSFKARVAPIDLDGGSSTREAFSREIHGRSVSSIKNYWQRQIFSGSDVPPPEVGSDAEVIRHVEQNPGAIGYVSAAARVDSVKQVSVSN